MTLTNPPESTAKPAANVIALDSFRDPIEVALRDAKALVDRLNARIAVQTPVAIEPPEITAEQQAAIDASVARLRDSSTWIVDLRASFSPIAAAIATMATAAASIEETLQSGETPSLDQLADAIRVSSAILNGDDMDGLDLEHSASEALQYAALLNGDYAIDGDGDVVDAKRRVAS